MKGFQEKTTGDGIFFVIKHNTICRESKTPQEGFKAIVVENPETKQKITKYIQEYNSLEAMITKIEWYDTEQKYTRRYRGFKVHLDANGKHGTLDFPIQSRVTSRFMKVAENIDFTKPVEFRAWKDNKSDSTALMIAQDDKSVPQKYTREEPGDMPPPVQRSSTGKWSYDDQMEFLHQQMLNVVIPRVAAITGSQTEQKSAEDSSNPHDMDIPECDPKSTLGEIRKTVLVLAGTADNGSVGELLDNHFGTRDWKEISTFPEAVLKVTLKKMDELLPF